MNQSIRVEKARHVIAYAELWHASGVLLQIGRTRSDANKPVYLASSVFAAFAFEAFLNHVGSLIFRKSWSKVERSLSYEGKIQLLCERLDVQVDKGREPWQTISALFSRRNDVVHAKNEELADTTYVAHNGSYERLLYEGLNADWEQLGTETYASNVRAKLESAMQCIHDAANLGPSDVLFQMGPGSGTAMLLSVPLAGFAPPSVTGQ